MKRNPIIAIYSSNGFQETFTRAHKELLPIKFSLTGGTPPKIVNDVPMLPMAKIHVIIRKIKSIFGFKIQIDDPINYFFKNNRVDILIAEFGMAGAIMVPYCRKYKVKLIVNFYGIDAFGYKILEDYKKEYKEMFEYASAFSVQSNSIRNKLISIGCPAAKVELNSCPPSNAFNIHQPTLIDPTLITVGRFVEKKAPLLVIKSFNEILKDIPDANLIMIGDGPLLESSKELAYQLKIDNKINFTGKLPPDEQLAYLKASSVFVQHSVTARDGDAEGLPVAIMEASLLGLPVVSTNHSGIPEAVEHNVTGFLVDEGDYMKMAEYCKELLSSIELRKSMGIKGKNKIAKNFTMKIHLDKMNNLIESVINE